MKKFLIISGLAAALVAGAATAADAHGRVSLGIFFGYPHYSYQMGPGYMYRPGYGWYYPGHRHSYYYPANRMSCWQARQQVRARGYYNIATVECNGSTYTFWAMRSGYRATVYVNARTGGVWRG